MNVSKGSTLANPDHLNETELRRALAAANEQLIQRDLLVVTMQGQLQQFANVVNTICQQVLSDDMAGLTATLARLAAAYREKQLQLKRGMH